MIASELAYHWTVAMMISMVSMAVFVWSLTRGLDLLAHCARYRRHRRLYPAGDRGRTWSATR